MNKQVKFQVSKFIFTNVEVQKEYELLLKTGTRKTAKKAIAKKYNLK